MKLRGGLWVANSSDAEALAAEVKLWQDGSNGSPNDRLAAQSSIAIGRQASAAELSTESTAIDFAVREVKALMP